jgi:molybdopterin converting factor small subunit
VPVLRLFAAAREAAGTGHDDVPGDSVGAVLAAATERYGAGFAAVLTTCRIWLNGDPVDLDAPVGPGDEVAVLPPVSGGSDDSSPADVAHVRRRRQELQALDDAISYARRVAQARADLTRAEQQRRTGVGGDLTADLTDVLADRLLGDNGRPPRPAQDFSEHARSVELDEICAHLGFARLDELDDEELARLAAELAAFERRTSMERRAIFEELDGLTEQLVEDYRATYADTDAASDES